MRSLRLLTLLALCSTPVVGAGCPSIPGECRDDIDCGSGEVCRPTADTGQNACIPRAPDTPDGGPAPDDAGNLIDSGPSVLDAGDDAGPQAGDAGDDAGAPADDAGDVDDGGAGDGGAGDGGAGDGG